MSFGQDWRAIQEVLKKDPDISEALSGCIVQLQYSCSLRFFACDLLLLRIFSSKWLQPILKLYVRASIAPRTVVCDAGALCSTKQKLEVAWK